ncbi:MAG: hypothetical protein ACQEP3_01790 [Patescibacteria group bacterium]
MKKTIIFIVIIILLGVGWFFLQDEVEEPAAENGEEVEEEVEESEEEMDEETEDPYTEAEIIDPIDDRNLTMHEDLSTVLEEVFEQEAKLIDSGDVTVLTYVVNREITSDDAGEISDLLAEKGYETERTDSKDGFYDLDISITDEVLEEKYDGDFGGNPYIQVWTTERGEENAQMIIVKAL